MPSRSLIFWNTIGARALDDIEGAHQAVRGPRRGRGHATDQINHAYALLLAGNFQRFCRDLHSEASDHIVGALPSPAMQDILRVNLLRDRKLDGQNAQPGSIGADFGRFGLKFWNAVDLHDHRTKQRRNSLEVLNQWRNAIAHQDFKGVGVATLQLHTVRRWRAVCSALARSFDVVVHDHCLAVVGKAPW